MSDKFVFRKGQFVFAEVVDQIDNKSLVVNFEGRLLQVKNQTQKVISVGSSIRLVVNTVNPISFALAPEKTRSGLGLNIQA